MGGYMIENEVLLLTPFMGHLARAKTGNTSGSSPYEADNHRIRVLGNRVLL